MHIVELSTSQDNNERAQMTLKLNNIYIDPPKHCVEIGSQQLGKTFWQNISSSLDIVQYWGEGGSTLNLNLDACVWTFFKGSGELPKSEVLRNSFFFSVSERGGGNLLKLLFRDFGRLEIRAKKKVC